MYLPSQWLASPREPKQSREKRFEITHTHARLGWICCVHLRVGLEYLEIGIEAFEILKNRFARQLNGNLKIQIAWEGAGRMRCAFSSFLRHFLLGRASLGRSFFFILLG